MKIEILEKEREFKFSLETIGKVISLADIGMEELAKALSGRNYFLLAKPILIACGNVEEDEIEKFLKNNLYGEAMMEIMDEFAITMGNYLPETEEEKGPKKK